MMDFFKGKVTPKDWAITGGIFGVTVLLCDSCVFAYSQGKENRLQNKSDRI